MKLQKNIIIYDEIKTYDKFKIVYYNVENLESSFYNLTYISRNEIKVELLKYLI